MNLFKLSWKNLLYSPWSLLLSLILFALGTGLVSLLLLLNTQIQEKFEKNLAGIDLVVGAKGSPMQLILCNMYHVDNPTGNISLKEARPFLNPKHPLIRLAVPLSLGDSYRSHRIVGTTSAFVDSIYDGRIAEGKRWEADFEVNVGAAVAEVAQLKIGDEFYSSHGFTDDGINEHDHGQKFKVVGIFEPSGTVLDQLILTTPKTIWLVHDHEGHDHEGEDHEGHDHEEHDHEGHDHEGHDHEGHDHEGHDHEGHDHSTPAPPPPTKAWTEELDKEITSILIRYRSKTNWRSLNMPRNINENTDMQAAGPAYEINRLRSMMGNGEQLLRVLALVIIIVSGLSIFISLFSSLQERRYELALMRVMGASRVRLFSLIILEGLIIAILGCLLGLALSHIGMELFASYMEDSYRYSFTGKLFLTEELYLFLGALVIGLLAAIIPAIQASQTDISATLTES